MDTPFPFSVAIKATTDLHEATMNAAIIQTPRAQMRYWNFHVTNVPIRGDTDEKGRDGEKRIGRPQCKTRYNVWI